MLACRTQQINSKLNLLGSKSAAAHQISVSTTVTHTSPRHHTPTHCVCTTAPSPADSTGGCPAGIVSWILQHEVQGNSSCPSLVIWPSGHTGCGVVCLGVEWLGCFSAPCSSSFCLAAPAEGQLPFHNISPGSLLAPGDAPRNSEFFHGLVEPISLCRAMVVLPEPGPMEKVNPIN